MVRHHEVQLEALVPHAESPSYSKHDSAQATSSKEINWGAACHNKSTTVLHTRTMVTTHSTCRQLLIRTVLQSTSMQPQTIHTPACCLSFKHALMLTYWEKEKVYVPKSTALNGLMSSQ